MSDSKYVLLMLLVAGIWGATFPLVKWTLGYFGPFQLIAMRSVLGVLALAAYLAWKKEKISKEEWEAGAALGTVLFLGLAAQTIGLTYTTATNSAFVTGMLVIFTPLLAPFFIRKKPGARTYAAAVVSLAGLYLLSGIWNGAGLSGGVSSGFLGFAFNFGDAITLLTAIFFAVHINYLGKVAKGMDPVKLTLVQSTVGAVLGLGLMLPLEGIPSEFSALPMLSVLFLGVIVGAAALVIQAYSQKFISPSKVGLIFITEPVFAALLGFAFLGEVLGIVQGIGAGLILVGMGMAEN